MVQWPELCTRGAISFATSSPLFVRKSSMARTPVLQLREDARRVRLRAGLGIRRPRVALRHREAEDARAVLVLDERIEARISVLATDGEDRQLALERHEALHDERRRAERLPTRAPRPQACTPSVPCRHIPKRRVLM